MVKNFCFGWHPVNDGAAPVNEGGGRWCEHPLRSSLFRGPGSECVFMEGWGEGYYLLSGFRLNGSQGGIASYNKGMVFETALKALMIMPGWVQGLCRVAARGKAGPGIGIPAGVLVTWGFMLRHACTL